MAYKFEGIYQKKKKDCKEELFLDLLQCGDTVYVTLVDKNGELINDKSIILRLDWERGKLRVMKVPGIEPSLPLSLNDKFEVIIER